MHPNIKEIQVIIGSKIFWEENTFVRLPKKQLEEKQGFVLNSILNRFCYIRSCGCVIAEKALKEISTSTCLVCGKLFSQDDVIVINGKYDCVLRPMYSAEDRKSLRERMEKRRLKEKKSVTFGIDKSLLEKALT